MKVCKRFHGSGERTGDELFVSKAIDEACKKMHAVWPWTSMEFSIGRQMSDKIFVPLNDFSITARDSKAAVSFVLQRMHLYYIKRNGFSVPNKKIAPLIEQIAANRVMVKNGFADELSYYYYVLLVNRNKYVRTLTDFLDVSSSWLSFYGVDNYNASLFRDMVRQMFKIESDVGRKGSEFLGYLKTGLKDNVYKHADEMAKKYYEILKS